MASFLKMLRVRFAEPALARDKAPVREHVRVSNPWHAVSVVPGAACCAAVKALSGKRYLSSEGPPALPLKQCTMVACTCRYRHHDDRRARSSGTRRPSSDVPKRRVEDAPPH